MSFQYERWSNIVSLASVGAADYITLFKFFCNNVTINNNLLQFWWLSVPDSEFTQLHDLAPIFWEWTKNDIASVGKMFSILKSPPVLTQTQKNALDELVKTIILRTKMDLKGS